MLLEFCTVSRKTPGDGKLQVSAATFAVLRAVGEQLAARTSEGSAPLALSTIECTCGKFGGEGGSPHTHYFVDTPLARALTPEVKVRLDLTGGELSITPVVG